jgi:hypothetical protein
MPDEQTPTPIHLGEGSRIVAKDKLWGDTGEGNRDGYAGQ